MRSGTGNRKGVIIRNSKYLRDRKERVDIAPEKNYPVNGNIRWG